MMSRPSCVREPLPLEQIHLKLREFCQLFADARAEKGPSLVGTQAGRLLSLNGPLESFCLQLVHIFTLPKGTNSSHSICELTFVQQTPGTRITLRLLFGSEKPVSAP